MTSRRLEGRTALVTGAGRGLGRAIAARLASEGASVAVHCHQSEQGARSLVEELSAAGGRALFIQGDLRNPSRCQQVVAEAERGLGSLDILVHNAGISRGGPLMASDLEGIRQTLEVNLLAALYCTAAAVPGMLRRRFGRVVAISSAVAESGGQQGQCAYAASKAGLLGFIRTLANELSPRADFTANLVSPGVIPTDLSAFGIDTIGDQLRAAIPLGRFGEPEDAAAAVAYVVSPEGHYVNGHNLVVDGGYSLKYLNRRRAKEGSSAP